MKHFIPTMNKILRKLIHKKYHTITINECNTSKKCCDCNKYKKNVFRTRDANYSINIMKLTSCWIEKQERHINQKEINQENINQKEINLKNQV